MIFQSNCTWTHHLAIVTQSSSLITHFSITQSSSSSSSSIIGLHAECELRALSGNAVDVQASRVFVKNTLFIDNVSWDLEHQVVDGVVIIESDGRHMGAVRMENTRFEVSQDNEHRQTTHGSDVGALNNVWFYIDDAAKVTVNKISGLKPLPIAYAQSNWATLEDPKLVEIKKVHVAAPSHSIAKSLC
jgi:hypothetical protein